MNHKQCFVLVSVAKGSHLCATIIRVSAANANMDRQSHPLGCSQGAFFLRRAADVAGQLAFSLLYYADTAIHAVSASVIRRAEEFKKKATALSPAIRLEELSVFTYQKKNVDKT
jgi:hypothetical protein